MAMSTVVSFGLLAALALALGERGPGGRAPCAGRCTPRPRC
ncbi:hypothetical protein ACFQ1I_32140 [Kitasatospora arboriphila]